VSGYDLTLSAPKSVSILFALADDESRAAIERVQLEAAQAVIAMLNQEAAFTRRGHNGVVIEKASLIVAAFQHGEARPAAHSDGRVFADMDLHSHLCIANIVENLTEKPRALSDNRKGYSAVDGRAIYAHKMLAGSVYHLALSAGLQKLGFDVAVTGTNGIFEVVKPGGGPNSPDRELAVDANTKRYFSARRSKIEQILAEYDLVTGEAQPLAGAIGKATRLSKSDSQKDRFELWREIATERGIECATFAQDLRTDRKLTDREREALIGERLAQVPMALTEQESVFERRTLLAAVASALVGTGVDPNRINVEVERIISSKQIVALGQDIYGHGLYSTPEMIAIEKRLQVTARKMADRKWAALDPNWIKSKCDEMGLSEEQQNAALAATNDCAISVISGAAGSGKTSTMTVVVAGFKEGKGKSGSKKVLGAAISWRTAEMLNQSLGVEAFSVDSLLAQISAGKPVLDRDTVLIVDECGQVGSRTMDRLLTAITKAHAKVVLIGDVEQLQPINAGPALKILNSILEPARIEKIVRQRETWARDAAQAFAKGNAAAGLKMYAERGLVRDCAGAKATVETAVNEYRAAQQAAPNATHLLIAKSNKTVRALNAELRRHMREDGLLTGPEYILAADDSSSRGFHLSLAVGDNIRFGIRQDAIGDGVINGTVGVVQEIAEEADGHLAITAMIEGKQTSFSTRLLADKTGRPRLGHNLAVTAYSSQGLTAETATVVLDAGYDRHTAYVAMSRARGIVKIAYDSNLALSQITAERPFDAPAQPISIEERLAFLATRISRANLKTSTLALTEPDGPNIQARDRSKGLSR
jgi:conjugative relaxase-like TrwC/TraI family protein